jgi:hypothetical protein
MSSTTTCLRLSTTRTAYVFGTLGVYGRSASVGKPDSSELAIPVPGTSEAFLTATTVLLSCRLAVGGFKSFPVLLPTLPPCSRFTGLPPVCPRLCMPRRRVATEQSAAAPTTAPATRATSATSASLTTSCALCLCVRLCVCVKWQSHARVSQPKQPQRAVARAPTALDDAHSTVTARVSFNACAWVVHSLITKSCTN